MILPAEKLKSS